MLAIDKNGWTSNHKITLQECSAIEHLPLHKINALVLHRTDTSTAKSVLNAWKTRKEGAHFLISETGSIYQTASLKRQCWHVGKLYSRCRQTSSCSKEDAKKIEEILHRKNTHWGKKYRLITRLELNKNYPARFPQNMDSIGVEIVGLLSGKTEIYEIPNKLQLNSLFWLVDELLSTFSLTLNDIYAHGKIAHKDKLKSEGASALKAYAIHRKAK